MKTTLTIQAHVLKASKSGKPYDSFDTSEGNMSVFEQDIVNKLKANIGKQVNVEVEIRNEGKFKNIVGLYDNLSASTATAPVLSKDQAISRSVYVSYAKDLIVSGMKPEDAIVCIKKLQEAFK